MNRFYLHSARLMVAGTIFAFVIPASSAAKPPPPPSAPARPAAGNHQHARIVEMTTQGQTLNAILDKGESSYLAVGWRGKVLKGLSDDPLTKEENDFVVSSVTTGEAKVVFLKLSLRDLGENRRVVVAPYVHATPIPKGFKAAHIVQIENQHGKLVTIVDKGTQDGIERGWHGYVVKKGVAEPLTGAQSDFVVSEITDREAHLTFDRLNEHSLGGARTVYIKEHSAVHSVPGHKAASIVEIRNEHGKLVTIINKGIEDGIEYGWHGYVAKKGGTEPLLGAQSNFIVSKVTDREAFITFDSLNEHSLGDARTVFVKEHSGAQHAGERRGRIVELRTDNDKQLAIIDHGKGNGIREGDKGYVLVGATDRRMTAEKHDFVVRKVTNQEAHIELLRLKIADLRDNRRVVVIVPR